MARRLTNLPVPALVAGVCALVVAVAIFVLTEQAPEVTSAESDWVNALLIRLFGASGLYDSDTGLWAGIGVRHWAHTVEFGALGLCVALAAHFAQGSHPVATSLAICVGYSLFDQCHKLFVPGRHFDWFDLVMDALGYVIAIALVLGIAKLRERHTHRDARA